LRGQEVAIISHLRRLLLEEEINELCFVKSSKQQSTLNADVRRIGTASASDESSYLMIDFIH
jgi:hypothetical protein